MRQLAVAVIVAGYWGPNLVRSFRGTPNWDLVAVCDLDAERAQRVIGPRSTVEVETSLESVLRRADVDAVAIATPARTHAPIALAVLDAGKHVLVEKPLADAPGAARSMVAAARDAGRVLMIDHTYCYTPAGQYIRRAIDDGVLGDLLSVDSTRINLGLVQLDADVFWDLAPQDLEPAAARRPVRPRVDLAMQALDAADRESSLSRTALAISLCPRWPNGTRRPRWSRKFAAAIRADRVPLSAGRAGRAGLRVLSVLQAVSGSLLNGGRRKSWRRRPGEPRRGTCRWPIFGPSLSANDEQTGLCGPIRGEKDDQVERRGGAGHRRGRHDRLHHRRPAARRGCRGGAHPGQPGARRANLVAALRDPRAELTAGDLRVRNLVHDLTAGVDVVFHEAAIRTTQGAEEPRLALEVLVDGTFTVLEAVEHRVDKIVAAWSAPVYGRPTPSPDPMLADGVRP